MTVTKRRGPGRPRAAEVDLRVRAAMLTLMAQHGYKRVTLDQVAAAAGVAKPTLYRRYPDKATLAVAALRAWRDERHPFPAPTGDTRADLIAQLAHFRTGIERPHGLAMVGTVLAEAHDTPALLREFRAHIVGPRRRALRAVLAAARARGELRAGADLDLAVNCLLGAYYAQALAGRPFVRRWAAQVVEAVLTGLAA